MTSLSNDHDSPRTRSQGRPQDDSAPQKVPLADRFGILLAILATAFALFLAAARIDTDAAGAAHPVESLADYKAKNLSP